MLLSWMLEARKTKDAQGGEYSVHVNMPHFRMGRAIKILEILNWERRLF